MSEENKRIINYTTDGELVAGDYVVIDSASEGTKKFDLGAGLAAIDTALDTKVDKVTGKGLSTEDYTTAEKTKLSGIEAQANKTVLDTALATTGKAADAKATGDAISAEASARQSGDATVQAAVSSEASARQSADTTLQSNIDAETQARQSADSTLQSNITSEATVRQSADTALQQNITAEATARENAVTELKEDLSELESDGVVPSAEQLLSDNYTIDQTPYLYRQTNSNGADRAIEEIVGGSVVWNQLCNGSSVTVTSDHKYLLKKSNAWSVGTGTGSAITGLTSGSDMVCDLTVMFGTTIADYIYSLEQSSAGAGVAFFRALFPEEYYAYNQGTMMHVSGVSAKVTRDADENVIGNYSLDSSLTLRGIPKLDSNNQLYYDGDTYAADGTVTRKYGIVDLGTLDWTYVNTSQTSSNNIYAMRTVALSSLIKKPSGSGVRANIVCSKYIAVTHDNIWGVVTGIAVTSDGQVQVYDPSYNTQTSYTAFKTAMSGVYLVYELATPTTETADPYTNPHICDPYGTEEFVSTSLVPVGHYTKYPENLRAKIENLDLSMIAPIETGTTASQAYAVGKYFLLNNQFCKAKTAIASGATFTLNTNYEVTTIADELYTALNA